MTSFPFRGLVRLARELERIVVRRAEARRFPGTPSFREISLASLCGLYRSGGKSLSILYASITFLVRIAERLQATPAGRRTSPGFSRGIAHSRRRRHEMLDATMLAIGLAFFALALAYGAACERM